MGVDVAQIFSRSNLNHLFILYSFIQGTCDPFWSSQKDHLPYFSFKKFIISEFTGIFIITKLFYYFCLFFVYVFFIFSKYGMIYMYFKGWRLTDSLLMADMSKVYIMRRGWTLCLDGIGLAISRSQVGQVRSPGHGYRTVDGQLVGRFLTQTTLVRPVGIAGQNGLIKMEGSKGEVVILILFIWP